MKRHRFDPFSFLAGLLFAGLALAYFVDEGRFRLDAGPWLWPIILLAGGVVVLAAATRDRDERPADNEAPAADDPFA